MPDTDDYPPVEESMGQLHRAGWSVGDVAFEAEGGGLVWVVSGSNGENLIHASGPTPAVAWHRAAEQARAPGVLRLWLAVMRQAPAGSEGIHLGPSSLSKG